LPISAAAHVGVQPGLFERQRGPGAALLLPLVARHAQPEIAGRIDQERPDPLALGKTEPVLIQFQPVTIEGFNVGFCSSHVVALLGPGNAAAPGDDAVAL
jgi:hypothetical protein